LTNNSKIEFINKIYMEAPIISEKEGNVFKKFKDSTNIQMNGIKQKDKKNIIENKVN